MNNEIALVGVDWGTTNRRTYALDASGSCHQIEADEEGSLACKGRFPSALESALQAVHGKPKLVVMTGMVGSALGWQEAPYLDARVSLFDLPRYLLPVRDSPASCDAFIVPGYCVRNGQGQPDVMRGEETQLLGALTLGHHSGWFVLPGTHSKWVELDAGRIVQLRTYMTGELFELLRRHGTVAAAAGAVDAVWDSAAFSDGVKASRQGAALSHQLFGCRARVVCGDMPASSTQAYLSGLLIGTELADVVSKPGTTHGASVFRLIGSVGLATRYQAAAEQLGMVIELIDSQAVFIAAMSHIQNYRRNL